jgi:predicted RNA-binding Zn-ribbon protein involved in translation (DUF1610 family)
MTVAERKVNREMATHNDEEMATLTGFDRWMAHHNGPDAISRLLLILVVVLIACGIFLRFIPLIMIAIIVLLVILWRVLSTNIIKRRKEESALLSHMGVLRPWLANPVAAHVERKTYRHVKCPTCGQKARLPKGVGKVVVTCPSCGDQYIKKG